MKGCQPSSDDSQSVWHFNLILFLMKWGVFQTLKRLFSVLLGTFDYIFCSAGA